MSRKKIVFVIVEGPSDDLALSTIITRLYDESEVYVEIMHGDITSNYDIDPNKIVGKIGNIVKEYGQSRHYKAKDFREVIHLLDTDGVYIPNTCIMKDSSAAAPIYSLGNIKTDNPNELINRNVHKQKCLQQLIPLNSVWRTIPYNVYYMSCNLDHVLYGKLNSSDTDKCRDAIAFSEKYKDNLDGFLTFISDSNFSVLGDYKDSWDYIKKKCHSLERHSNLGICFQKIRK